MKYLPWNRLQIDSAIDGGWRVSKKDVNFSLFRTFKRKIYWVPLYQSNGALMYGDLPEQRDATLRNFAEQSKRMAESTTVALFDLSGEQKELGAELEEQSLAFEYHPYEDNLEQFLEDLNDLRTSLRNKNKGSGYLEPPNRKILTIIFELNETLIQELELSLRSRELMRDLLLNSDRERLYLFPIASSASRMPGEIMRAFDWIVYLGEENKGFAKGLHKKLEEAYYSFSQLLIGTHYSKHEKRLTPVHPLKFTPSEWHLAQKEKLEKEDAAYEEFLNALDDGTRLNNS